MNKAIQTYGPFAVRAIRNGPDNGDLHIFVSYHGSLPPLRKRARLALEIERLLNAQCPEGEPK